MTASKLPLTLLPNTTARYFPFFHNVVPYPTQLAGLSKPILDTRCASSVFAVQSTKPPLSGLGAIRTATKRAGGTVRNHGGSPGKRLGVKKFSGETRAPGDATRR